MDNPSVRTQPELVEEISALKKRIEELEWSERELRLSRQQLRLLIDSGPDLFFLKDLDLRYQLVNSANAGFFGRDEADILGRDDVEFMPEGRPSHVRGAIDWPFRRKGLQWSWNRSVTDSMRPTNFRLLLPEKLSG
jgi:PAS domain-containing protein